MKVEQLKAELVVFKGLMSNVSAANAPLTLFSRGLTRRHCPRPGRAGLARCGLLISCLPPLPLFGSASVFFFPLPPPSSGEKEGRQVPCMGEAAYLHPH